MSDWTLAFATVVLAVATIVLCIATFKMHGSNERMATAAEKQQAANYQLAKATLWQVEEQFRPRVVVRAVAGLGGVGHFDLLIENLGATTAHEVHISVPDGVLLDREEDGNCFAGQVREYLADHHELPPGARTRLIWRIQARKPDGRLRVVGAEPHTIAAVTYQGESEQEYSEDFALDCVEFQTAPTTGPDNQATDPEIKFYRNAEHALRAIARHVGELRR